MGDEAKDAAARWEAADRAWAAADDEMNSAEGALIALLKEHGILAVEGVTYTLTDEGFIRRRGRLAKPRRTSPSMN